MVGEKDILSGARRLYIDPEDIIGSVIPSAPAPGSSVEPSPKAKAAIEAAKYRIEQIKPLGGTALTETDIGDATPEV